MTGSLDEAHNNFVLDAPASVSTFFYLLVDDKAYGNFNSSLDIDAYFLHLDVGSNYTVTASPVAYPFTLLPQGDPTFSLLNSSGSIVGSPTSNADNIYSQTFTATDSLYFVDVFRTGQGGYNSYYSVQLTNNSVTETKGLGEFVSLGQVNSTTLDYASDSDRFKFFASRALKYRIEVSSTVPDITLAIQNANTPSGGTFTASPNGYIFTVPTLQLYELAFASNSFTGIGAYSFSVLAYPFIRASDFDGDLTSDIVMQNASGQASLWFMNGGAVRSSPLVGGNPGPAWHVVGSGDFDGDGKSDILWRNDSGQVQIWFMNGATVTGSALVGDNPGTAWQIKGTGDVNLDGKSDILWQNDAGQAGSG